MITIAAAGFGAADWVILGVYMAALVGTGIFFARHRPAGTARVLDEPHVHRVVDLESREPGQRRCRQDRERADEPWAQEPEALDEGTRSVHAPSASISARSAGSSSKGRIAVQLSRALCRIPSGAPKPAPAAATSIAAWNCATFVSLVATRIRHTALPDGVYLRSGSATSCPAQSETKVLLL